MTTRTENTVRLFIVSFIFCLVIFFGACPGRAADSSDARFNEAAEAYQKRDFATAAERFGQAGEMYLKKGGTLKAAQCFFNRGLCLIYSARNEEAIISLERAADLYGKAKNASGVSQSLLYAAQLYMDAMNWEAAGARYERAMKAGGKDKLISALSTEGLGRIAREKGNLAEAETLFRQAEKLHANNPGGALRAKLQIAYTIGARGRETEALEIYDAVIKEASALQKKSETRDDGNRLVYYATSDKGQFLLGIGAFADAKKTMEEAMKLGEKIEDVQGEYAEASLALRTDYAQSLMYLGDFGAASREFNELLGIAEGSDNRALSMRVNAALGTLSRMKGDDGAAFDFFTNFKSIAERANHAQGVGQALIQLANLYAGMGLWNEAAAYYQQAFYTALTAQDMDSAIRAMQGIYNGDLRNEMGLVGKVDYRTIQGLPWRSALTARFLRNPDKRRPEHVDRGFDAAWHAVDSRRERQEIPSLDGFRAIREIAFRGAPEVRDYYQEVKTSYAIADAVLRQAETDLSSARKAGTALRELAARKDEAHESQYADRAFSVTANLLRSLAGQELLTAPAREFSVRTDGIMMEAVSPLDAEPVLTELEDDIKTLGRMADVISLKAAETEALQKSMTAGQLMPEDIKSRLRKAVFARADKELEPERLKEILFRTLESAQPTLRKEMGSLARKEGKLYDYANNRIQRQREALRAEAERIFPRVSPYMLITVDSGGEMLRYVNAWRRMRLRSLIMADLGINIARDKDWPKFLSGFGNSVRDAGKMFERTFAMDIEDAEAVNKTAARLRSLAEKITVAGLEDEGRNIGSILAAGGNISYDDRMSVLDLQARIRFAMSKFDAAEESARQILSMLPGEDIGAQPEKQWRAHGMLASIAANRGDHAEASRLYDIAIDKLDSIHPIEGTTSQSASDRVSLYGGAVGSAFALWKESPSPESVARVWRVLEGMKSRHWREMLATTGGEFLNVLPPEEREQVRALEARRVELEAAYNRARFLGHMDEAAAHNEEIRTVLAKRGELTRGKTVDVDTMPGADAVREKLPPDWALADYYISPELSFAVLLKKNGEPAVIQLDVDYDSLFGYSYWMRYANNDIDIAEYDENKFSNSLGADRAFVTACGLSPDDVGAMILKPVAEACGDIRKLLVIPHDILYILPLEAAQSQGDDGKPSYYVREWTFAELPSAFLLTRETGRTGADSSLMLVANPTYAPLLGERTWMSYAESLLLAAAVDPELNEELAGRLGADDLGAALANATPEDRRVITSKLARYWNDIVEETSRDSRIASAVKSDFAIFMRPLDGSQAEAEDLETMWMEHGKEAPNVLLAGGASEEKFWDENPAKYRYVHIACHGYDRSSIPTLQPGLALSPIRDTKNDSFLQMGELASVKWNADLITLSACETGLGELYIGDGMLGLSTVLLAGGAKGVVVTRWRASDESAPIFMRDFYGDILKGKHPADALRAAQLSVLNDSGYRVPRHWAIFKYVGIPW